MPFFAGFNGSLPCGALGRKAVLVCFWGSAGNGAFLTAVVGILGGHFCLLQAALGVGFPGSSGVSGNILIESKPRWMRASWRIWYCFTLTCVLWSVQSS